MVYYRLVFKRWDATNHAPNRQVEAIANICIATERWCVHKSVFRGELFSGVFRWVVCGLCCAKLLTCRHDTMQSQLLNLRIWATGALMQTIHDDWNTLHPFWPTDSTFWDFCITAPEFTNADPWNTSRVKIKFSPGCRCVRPLMTTSYCTRWNISSTSKDVWTDDKSSTLDSGNKDFDMSMHSLKYSRV